MGDDVRGLRPVDWFLIAVGTVVVVVALSLLLGCASLGDLLRIERTGPPPLPERPAKTIEHQEAIRGLADWDARMLRKVGAEGAPVAAPAVIQAACAAEIVSGDLGAPSEGIPLPLPGSYEAVPEAAQVIDTAEEERTDFAEDTWQWDWDLNRYAGKAVKREWRFGIPLLGTVAGLAAVAWAISVAVRYGLRWKTALWQTFLGVRKFLEAPEAAIVADDAAKGLKTELSKAMDEATKQVIRDFYAKVEGRK